MALLRLAVAEQGPHDITALTVNHALRSESASEARQVKRWCKSLGVAHKTLKWKHAKITTGIQAKARKARYDLMTAWCLRHGVASLLTAHTADDQSETIAMRAKRTSSVKSLAGIWPETEWQGVTILRPLLHRKRKSLRDYLERLNQAWIEDPSNEDERFERIRIRKAQAPNRSRVATAAQRLVKAAKAEADFFVSTSVAITPFGMTTIGTFAFAKLSAEARDEALIAIIAAARGQAADRKERDKIIRWLLAPDQPRRTLSGLIFAKHRSGIIVAREPARISPSPLALSAKKPVLWDNRFLVTGPAGAVILPKAAITSLKRNRDIPAFVDQGLPVVLKNGRILACPLRDFDYHPEVKLKFITK